MLEQALKRSRQCHSCLCCRRPARRTARLMQDVLPLDRFLANRRARDRSASATIRQNAVWRSPTRHQSTGKPYPTFAAKLSGREHAAIGADSGSTIPFDPFDPVQACRPWMSVAAESQRRHCRARPWSLASRPKRLGDQFSSRAGARRAASIIHVIGAETLKDGKPIDLGWIPSFLLAAVVVVLPSRAARASRQWLHWRPAVVVLLSAPVLLEAHQVFADVTPGLFVYHWVGYRPCSCAAAKPARPDQCRSRLAEPHCASRASAANGTGR